MPLGGVVKKLCATCQNEYEESFDVCPDDGGKLLTVEGGDDPLIGQTVDGRYVVQSLLGQGGMGAVYQAHQKTMNRAIALKVLKRELSSDPQIVKRFLREVQAVSVLSHPNTITVYDFGQTPENLLYIAMEFLEGSPLSDRIKEEGPRTVDRALDIIIQVSGALIEAHDKGVVHRDLKPDNIFLANMGGKEVVKVLDFGIAKLDTGDNQTQLTRSGLTVGTPPYMSPEQAEGRSDITARSDIYSLGCILFECLTGKPPFHSESPVKILMDHCTAEVPALNAVNPTVQVPPAVEQAIRAMLEKRPEARPQTAQAVFDGLTSLRAGVASGAVPTVGAQFSGDFSMDETGSFDSAEINAMAQDIRAAAAAPIPGHFQTGPGAFPTGPHAFQTGPTPQLNTEMAGEAVPISTDAAMAATRRKGVPIVPIVVGILLVAGAGAGFALLSKGGKSASNVKPSASAKAVATPVNPASEPKVEAKEPAEPAAPEARSIWIRSTPRAELFELTAGKEEKLGRTPFEVEIDPKRVREFKLKESGYKTAEIAVDPAVENDMSVQLAAAPRVVRRARPARRPSRAKAKPSEEDILVDDLK